MSLPDPGPRPGASHEPLITALVAERCPACGARLASAAQWCSLCFADLRPAATPPASASASTSALAEAATAFVAGPAVGAATQTGTPSMIAGAPRATWPCSGCDATVDVDLDACPVCGTGFLGALRASTSGIELPVIGDLGRLSDKSRVVFGAAAGLVIALVLVLLTALLGR